MSLNIIHYPDAPLLPPDVEEDARNQIYNNISPTLESEIRNGKFKLFRLYEIKPGLTLDFLREHFGHNLSYRIQTQVAGVQPIHIDPIRTFAINYYLDLGGSNCITHFYNSCTDTVPLESHRIESHKWYKLNVTVPHHVVGITTTRVAITVCDW